jgi:DNA-binding MarR family transcriptional regulator
MNNKDIHKAEWADVAARLHSAAIHLLRRVKAKDKSTGEGPARLSALSVLVFGGPKTLGKLAAAEDVKPPTMTHIVTGLECSGLVERIADIKDGRRVQIRATAKGVRLLMGARKKRIQYLSQQLKSISSQELHRLAESVKILEKILQNWR